MTIVGLHAAERLLRLPEVGAQTGLSTASIYRKMHSEGFPKPVSLGPMSRAWLHSEIQSWIKARIEERNQTCGSAEPVS